MNLGFTPPQNPHRWLMATLWTTVLTLAVLVAAALLGAGHSVLLAVGGVALVCMAAEARMWMLANDNNRGA